MHATASQPPAFRSEIQELPSSTQTSRQHRLAQNAGCSVPSAAQTDTELTCSCPSNPSTAPLPWYLHIMSVPAPAFRPKLVLFVVGMFPRVSIVLAQAASFSARAVLSEHNVFLTSIVDRSRLITRSSGKAIGTVRRSENASSEWYPFEVVERATDSSGRVGSCALG